MLNATPLLRLYAKYRNYQLNRQNPANIQTEVLLRLVKKAENTRFGKEHAFSKIASVSDFQQRVPLRYYEDFWKEYWQPAFPNLQN
ncbi:GH3 auxin-responsive promoter family protein, partial [Oligoflexia bacterium]|nr:GH3 auxin-responsive promoter family protein [Oligoflexia bacterium]